MRLKEKFYEIARRIFNSRKFIYFLIISTLLSVIATYAAITKGSVPFASSPKYAMKFLIVDLVLLLLLIIVFAKKSIGFFAFKKNSANRLQNRIILMFSALFSVPTIVISIFSYLFFSYGIESWFNDKVSRALEESVIVSEAYLTEHKEAIRVEALKMANVIESAGLMMLQDVDEFNEFLDRQASVRSLTEIVVFQPNKLIAQNSLSFSLIFNQMPVMQMQEAKTGEAVLLFDQQVDKMRALVKLDNFFNTYLLVGRPIDQKILNHVQKTNDEVSEYRQLKSEISQMQIQFSIIFVVLSLILLIIAIMAGVFFTTVITGPINDLIKGTKKIQKGHFDFRVKEGPENDEIAVLARAFNNMIERLNLQRASLIEANQQIDEKRHFSETILSGVSAGIVVLDIHGKIAMINRSAARVLAIEPEDLVESQFDKYFPEMNEFLKEVMQNPSLQINKEMSVKINDRQFFFLIRIVAESFANNVTCYIVNFDDVTELIMAQRSAAWADVARKVAHEIKNPLTPIQLSVERIKRKYEKYIEEKEVETFTRYVETVKRHVGEIGKMVDEFITFARMPSPKIAKNDLIKLINNAIFSRQVLQNGVAYELHSSETELMAHFDKGQFERLLINIIKNSEESIFEKIAKSKKEHNSEFAKFIGRISIEISIENQYIMLTISDNGVGFGELLDLEKNKQFQTTKSEGSGLGLAIVKKIINDHSGQIKFANLSNGAEVKILLPKK